MSNPTRLIWKFEVYDDKGQSIATISRKPNMPTHIEIDATNAKGDPNTFCHSLSEALREVSQASRFLNDFDHPGLPSAPANPILN
jgi:hypothetical protein